MSSTAEVPIEDAAGEWGKNPASKVEKKPAPEKDKNSTREDDGIGVNLMLGKEQHEIDPQAQNSRNDKKTLEPIEAEEPASEGSSAAIKNREHISLSNKAGSYLPSNVVQTQLLAIPEEEAASKKPQLKMKKEKERKTAKLVKIKKEQQLGGVDKTQFPVEPHMPGDGEQAHSLCVPEEEGASRNLQMKKEEKKRKRIELEEIKKDEQLGGADKTQFPVEPHMPSDAEKAHSLCVPEEEDGSTPPSALPFPVSPLAQLRRRAPVNAMATASPEPLSSGQEGDEDEEVRLDDESDQALKEKLQRIQYGLNKFNPRDGGKKYRLLRDSINRELARRQAARSASPQPRPPCPPGRQGEPDNSRCERIIQSRHAESSGLPSDSNENHGLTKSDFFSAFKVDDEAGLDLPCMEITSASPSKPKTSVESEGKFCEVDESCETDGQPTCLSTEVSCMDNSIDLENLSPGDAFKDNGHNRIHEHASTPSRKRKGDDPGAFSMRLRSRKVQEVVLLDGDARHSESADKITNKRDAMKIYYPSSEHPQSVELSHDDIKCLEPESLLSSPIMNFYIMYLQQPMSSISIPKGKCHIFNTYFFSKLEALISKVDKASYFLKLRRWWKGIDIFRKAYILFPVHADTHWSLVIICMPSKEDQSGLIILHLDSLKFHRSRHIFSVVERFLKEEWSYLNKNGSLEECPIQEMVWKNLPRKIEKKPIAVPQQENEYDCGLFVLYYMQRFIEQAPERLHKKDLSMFGKRWFQPEEASALRTKIQSVLLQLFHEAKPNNNTPEQQTTGPSLVEAKSKNNLMEPTVPEQPVEGSSAKLASPNHLDGSSTQPTSFEHPLECS